MPQVLRLGANPPFQRVEETKGACKKARLFAIVRVFLLRCSKLGVSKCKKLSNPEMLVRCLGFTQVNTCLPRLDRGPCLRPSVVMDARMRGHDKGHGGYNKEHSWHDKEQIVLG